MKNGLWLICRTTSMAMGICGIVAAGGDKALLGMEQSFELVERLGVAHPEQIIDFDLRAPVDASKSHLLGPDGKEVPYQLIDDGKKLAVRTDIPLGAKKTWRLLTSRGPAAATEGVEVIEAADWYEITNGLVGIRVAKPGQADAAWKPLFDLLAWEADAPRVFMPAPVQGIRYRDGQWSGVGPNGLAALATACTDMTVTFRERGPLVVVAEVGYRFTRPDVVKDRAVALAGGPAGYTCTIKVQAGQPSILLEEDAETDVTWSMDLHAGLRPSRARYSGHHATKPEYGREPDGGVYRPWHNRSAPFDALVDLSYERPMPSTARRSDTSWGRMAVWNPWIYDSGWYWQVFDAQGPAAANLLGIFAGPASRALGAGDCGTGIFTLPPASAGGTPRAGLTVALYGRHGSNRAVVPRSRYAWGLFLGVQGEDLAAATEVQPIARQMNLHAGLNLNKLHRLQLTYADRPGGYGSLFIDPAVIRRMMARVRSDRTYRDVLFNQHTNPAHRDVVALWEDTSGQKARAGVEKIKKQTESVLTTLIHGNGIYDFSQHYWHGGTGMASRLEQAEQLLATGLLSPEEIDRVKAAAVVNAALLWDDDHTPLSAEHGLNLGNANMPIMQNGMRLQAVLYLDTHPMMVARLSRVADGSRGLLNDSISLAGSHVSAVGYITTSQPQFATLLALQNRGLYDGFREEPRVARFARFYLNLMTPPECRFGGLRKMLPVGDSSTDGSALMGYLATGMAKSHPGLSAQLMAAWRAMGNRQDTFYGPTLLRINQELPDAPPVLGDVAFPGYYSALRWGSGTADETAVWCVNGTTYADHAHNDLGTVIAYALGAPLSMDWSGRYPSTKAGVYHSTVIEEKFFGSPWDKDSCVDPQDGRETGGAGLSGHHLPAVLSGTGIVAPASTSQEGLLSLGSFARMASRFEHRGLVWRRVVARLNGNPDVPLILIEDTFDGVGADQPKIFTLNLMADGVVQTPAGELAPPPRSYDNPLAAGDGKRKELPSAGPVFRLEPGLHRLGFTGQSWSRHPSGGIDWDVYLLNDAPQQAQIGNWATFWQPHPEMAEFRAANGKPFEERQHILRVRGTGAFTTLLASWRKGEKPADLRVERKEGLLRVLAVNQTTTLGPDTYTCEAADRRVLAALSAAPAAGAGIRIEGGPAEVALDANRGSVTVHGAAGRRTIDLPGAWRLADPKPPCPASFEPSRPERLVVEYAGDEPIVIAIQPRY